MHSKVLQAWDGTVMDVRQDSFTAVLRDLTTQGPEEEAIFPKDEIRHRDHRYLVPGSVFTWRILRTRRGRARNVIRFSTAKWTTADLKAVRRAAKKLYLPPEPRTAKPTGTSPVLAEKRA